MHMEKKCFTYRFRVLKFTCIKSEVYTLFRVKSQCCEIIVGYHKK